MWESYGEDTYVNSQMAVASVLGFQGEDPNRVDDRHVAACIKHFMAYGVPVSGKDRTPSSVTRNVLREKYFAPFMECHSSRGAVADGQLGQQRRYAVPCRPGVTHGMDQGGARLGWSDRDGLE